MLHLKTRYITINTHYVSHTTILTCYTTQVDTILHADRHRASIQLETITSCKNIYPLHLISQTLINFSR